MPRQAVFHFPDRTEIRYLEARPEPGELVSSQGQWWVVVNAQTVDRLTWSLTLVASLESHDGRKQPESTVAFIPAASDDGRPLGPAA